MKYYLIILLNIVLYATTSAQLKVYNPGAEQGPKQFTGQFGDNDGIYVFEDGRFALYGYATFVLGNYTLNDSLIEFQPDFPDLFSVYGYDNPELKEQTKLMFQGFEEGGNYMQFGQQAARLVFHENASSFTSPYIHDTTAMLNQFAFYTDTLELPDNSLVVKNKWQFTNNGYNDFIFVFNKPSRYHLPFQGKLFRTNDNKIVLQTSANFGSRLLPFTPKDEISSWDEVLNWKNALSAATMNSEFIYANSFYNTITFDPEQYRLDDKTNLYIAKSNREQHADIKTESYEDTRFIKKYVKLNPTDTLKVDLKTIHLDPESIFNMPSDSGESSPPY